MIRTAEDLELRKEELISDIRMRLAEAKQYQEKVQQLQHAILIARGRLAEIEDLIAELSEEGEE